MDHAGTSHSSTSRALTTSAPLLLDYVNPYIRRYYVPTGRCELAVTDLELLAFHPQRFDLPAKIAYADAVLSNRVTPYVRRVYREHIQAFNGFTEPDGSGKRGEDVFFSTFENMLRVDAEAAPGPINTVPLVPNGMILDGSHRLARAYVRKEPLNLVYFRKKTWF